MNQRDYKKCLNLDTQYDIDDEGVAFAMASRAKEFKHNSWYRIWHSIKLAIILLLKLESILVKVNGKGKFIS